MQFLLLIYNDETGWANASPEEVGQILEAYDAFTREATDAGAFITGHGLEPTSAATTVRVPAGEAILTDGPFAETREQLGGFYLLECRDLDEALKWAAKIPGAVTGSVEVRPIMNYDARRSEEPAANHASA